MEGQNYVLVGLRHVGKSYLMYQRISELIGQGRQVEEILYFNFEDDRIGPMTSQDLDLIKTCYEEMYDTKPIFFLDEIQIVEGWEKFARRLADWKYQVYITGSNAKLLSSEMATLLTGRYLQIEMLPFSLQEFCEWKKALDSTIISDYLHNGGYPEILQSRQLTQGYLSTLFDSIIWKDIAQRHKVRNVEDLNNLAMYLLSNFCNPFSANELAEAIGMSSIATTKKFMGYLHEPYLF